MAIQAYPAQNKLICGKVGLSSGIQAYLPRFKVIHGKVQLFVAKRVYPRQKQAIRHPLRCHSARLGFRQPASAELLARIAPRPERP
jgi:hypothetical protein